MPPEIGAQTLLPPNLPARRFQARQVAIGAQRIEQRAIDSRCRPGRGKRGHLVRIPNFPEPGGPHLFTILRRERLHEFVVQAAIAQNIDTIPHDGGRCVAIADILRLPNESRPCLGPFLQQAGFGRNPIPLRSAPLRPVGGVRDQGKQDGAARTAQEPLRSHDSLPGLIVEYRPPEYRTGSKAGAL